MTKKILLLFYFFSMSSFAQISPGDLTKYHANLEGLENCTKCHNLGEQLTNSKCLDCHKEIRIRVKEKKGFHASSEVSGKNCWACHSEHNGRNFEIIRFDSKNFDHSKANFDLTGSHAKLECGKCHNSGLIKNSDLKKRKNTFLGLGTNCSDCHEDIHQLTLGKNCGGCHNTVKFKPAEIFNHNTAKFKITGAHLTVPCEKCHTTEKRGGKNFTNFTGLKFGQCTDCHKDVHAGKFGNDCTKCHNTTGYKNVNQQAFDHNKTNFPLIGLHDKVSCAKCHGSSLSSKPKHDRCMNCHKDYHNGEFTINDNQRDCAECHTEKGFSPSLFTIDFHGKTKFALTGSHLATPCAGCHKINNDWHFKTILLNCVNCHNNIHGEEISKSFMENSQCENCHNTSAWNEVRFDHNKTAFVLYEKHSVIACKDCHLKDVSGSKVFLFISLDTQCESCHKDIHNKQFAQNGKTDCEQCHIFESWKPERFDHNKTKFQLTGAHQSVLCSKCHKPVIENNITFIKYKIEEFKCADCHL